MKRPMLYLALMLAWIYLILFYSLYYVLFIPFGLTLVMGGKWRGTLVVLMGLGLVLGGYRISQAPNMEGAYGPLEGTLKGHQGDYIFSTDDFSILIKNDLEAHLQPGRYKVQFELDWLGNQNPGLFNYKHYLMSMNLDGKTRLSKVDYKLLEEDGGLNQLRQTIQATVRTRVDHLEASDQVKAFVLALLLGDKGLIDPDTYHVFQVNGTGHVLAISGMHIGLFYLIFQWPFYWLGHKRKFIALGCLFAFLWLIGWPYSGIRALALIGSSLACMLLKRPYDLLQGLGLVACLLLVMNPYVLYHVGFQYSFSALMVFAVVYQPIFSRVTNKVLGLVLMGLSLQVGLLPLTLYHQGQIHILSALINLLTIPTISLILYLSCLVLVVPIGPVVLLLDFLVRGLVAFNDLMFSQAGLVVSLKPLSLVWIFIFYTVLGLWLDKGLRKPLLILVCLVGLGQVVYNHYATEIYFLDLGQGDGALIRHRGLTILVDAGPDQDLLADILYKKGIDQVDYVFISHSHMDHIGGLYGLKHLTQDSVFYYKPPNQEDANFMNLDLNRLQSVDGLHYLRIKDLGFSFLPYPSGGSLNDASMVMVLEFGKDKILFTGDIEAWAESKVLAGMGPVDVIKVPHHGSDTSSSPDFLVACQPEVAIISSGLNFYGHPSPQVVSRYQARGTRVYRTHEGYVKLVIFPWFKLLIRP